MDARLTPRKTAVKECLELPPFVHEAFHITADNIKRGNGKICTVVWQAEWHDFCTSAFVVDVVGMARETLPGRH
jgi:hypothetical protein